MIQYWENSETLKWWKMRKTLLKNSFNVVFFIKKISLLLTFFAISSSLRCMLLLFHFVISTVLIFQASQMKLSVIFFSSCRLSFQKFNTVTRIYTSNIRYRWMWKRVERMKTSLEMSKSIKWERKRHRLRLEVKNNNIDFVSQQLTERHSNDNSIKNTS